MRNGEAVAAEGVGVERVVEQGVARRWNDDVARRSGRNRRRRRRRRRKGSRERGIGRGGTHVLGGQAREGS